MRSLKPLLAGLLFVLALALIGCSSGGSTGGSSGSNPAGTQPTESSAGATVTEKDLAFDPATLELKVGDTVTFTNEDSAPHNVSIDGKELGSQNQGDSVTWTAEKAGTFPYTCTVHPSMTGEIVVK
jgi:plastocyanin